MSDTREVFLTMSDALEEISNWSKSDVENLFRNNGLEEECCKIINKRNIGGDELLHLTEGKLALWKSDLTGTLKWSLWSFVEELKKNPVKYVEEKKRYETENENVSDTDSWATDFDDGIEESDNVNAKKLTNNENNKLNNNKTEDDSTYANCDISDISTNTTEMTYANFEASAEVQVSKLKKNESKLHSISNLTFSHQSKDVEKPTLSVKPKVNNSKRRQPQTSFLYTKSTQKSSDESEALKRLSVSSLPESLNGSRDSPINDISVNKNLPKPPGLIKSFDLVANLPTRTEESEDEYEPFDEEIIEQHQRRESMARVDSKQSLTSGHQSSFESLYHPSSITGHKEEKDYEIYEYITESPEEMKADSVLTKKSKILENPPPPLPVKPPMERSLDKKFATLPLSNSSLSSPRPLPPPPPDRQFTDKPWFHNVTRERAMALIREPKFFFISESTYPQDGYFLVRPSTTNHSNPLTLVLWYKDRVYNVPVRKRVDNRFALGSEKVNEQSFASVEEIVHFYSREELFLYTGGLQMGSTTLSDTPIK
ncbi:lymphocyte cytosolic protein 2-like isoform X1 [Leptopilina heterotoma]|uniref:lymphocyte cytosolic protein 2-like isoform X1 n=1 Tax=Leptopilina heterotoma TaxID=63436 RepID=UPI001CA89127|nr:lymphocyte cytosolic protein 2-like isoform X1 [Leptopilina heterotoma]